MLELNFKDDDEHDCRL